MFYDGFSFEQMSEAFKRLHAAEEQSEKRYQEVLDLSATVTSLQETLATTYKRMERPSPEEHEARLTALREGRMKADKIAMIKVVRTMTNLGLKEAKDLVEAMTE